MYRKQVIIGLVALATAVLLTTAQAQGQTTQKTSSPSLAERLDQFGQNLIGGVFSRKPKSRKSTAPTWQDPSLAEGSSPRAGSAILSDSPADAKQPSTSRSQTQSLLPHTLEELLVGQRHTQTATENDRQGRHGSSGQSVFSQHNESPSGAGSAQSRREATVANAVRTTLFGAPTQSPPADSPEAARSPTPEPPENRVAARPTISTPVGAGLIVHNTTIAAEQKATTAKVPVAAGSGGSQVSSQPLHKRLARLRQSVFGDSTPSTKSTTPGPTQTADETPTNAPPAGQPTLAPRRHGGEMAPTRAPERPEQTAPQRVAGRPTWAPASAVGTTADQELKGVFEKGATGSLSASADQEIRPRADKPPMAPTAARARASQTQEPTEVTLPGESPANEAVDAGPKRGSPAQTSGRKDRGQRVLLARRSPVLNVKTLGPARIAVGKRSDYEVHVENLGEVAADDVVVTIGLPEWAEVVGAEGSSGAILADHSPGGGKRLLWKIGPMEARDGQKAVLGIVPRASQPIDLAVRWEFTPIASQTVIEVEEPRLTMQLHGPREVRFAEPQVFKLEISNSGNGDAEDVVLTIMPLEPGQGGPAQHRLGTLAAGQNRVINMELTAGQPGSLSVRMQLQCDGAAKASLNETLLVRKANVELAIDAPKMQFTGTVATYRIRVKNSGNATADGVRAAVKIPPEAKLIAAGQKGKVTPDGRSVEWKLDRLPEGAEQELTIRCELVREGYSQIRAEAVGQKVSAEATAVTRVESIADLALSVSDPSGPVPLGEKATYTIRIHNRGTKDATGVEAIVYFSHGIEPVSAKGARYTIRPGQVLFDSIGVVRAGKEIVLEITAKAQEPGNHMFRAEVYCRALGTKLVGEETTHFYRAGSEGPRTMIARPMPDTTGPMENPARTADRRNQPAEASQQ